MLNNVLRDRKSRFLPVQEMRMGQVSPRKIAMTSRRPCDGIPELSELHYEMLKLAVEAVTDLWAARQ